MSEKNIRSAMNTMTHGVYVIGTHADGKYNLMTAAWLSQVSGRPPMLSLKEPLHRRAFEGQQ